MIELTLVENDTKTFEKTMESEMAKAIKHFDSELIKIRTGRAHTSIVEDIQVSCYGQAPMPLKAVASIAAPDVHLITIQPWDITVIPDIEKAIGASNLGVTPVNDGKIIRISLPKMSSDRRDELTKILGKKSEECKVSVRNVRKEFNNLIRDAKKDKKISENFFNRLSDSLQKTTDRFIKQTEEMTKKKEQDLRAI